MQFLYWDMVDFLEPAAIYAALLMIMEAKVRGTPGSRVMAPSQKRQANLPEWEDRPSSTFSSFRSAARENSILSKSISSMMDRRLLWVSDHPWPWASTRMRLTPEFI